MAGLETFELNSHFDCISYNKLCYCQQFGIIFNEKFGHSFGLFDLM